VLGDTLLLVGSDEVVGVEVQVACIAGASAVEVNAHTVGRDHALILALYEGGRRVRAAIH
jgi:hypothetical protein